MCQITRYKFTVRNRGLFLYFSKLPFIKIATFYCEANVVIILFDLEASNLAAGTWAVEKTLADHVDNVG
jgi:hypothetical protein